MDSLSQLSLGAAVMGAMCGRKLGRKAILIGAVIGTIPDLDVFIPYGGDVENFTYHRGFTHSLIFCMAMTYPIAWVLSRFKSLNIRATDLHINLNIFTILITHALLDAMTIYGTQIFWPLESVPPSGVGSIFIIDPLYTLPLLIGLGAMLIRPKSIPFLKSMLLISTTYLLWSIAAQTHVKMIANQQLPEDTIDNLVLVQPTPFNTLLWRVLVMTDDGYDVAYYSLFDDSKDLKFKSYPSNPELLEPILDSFAAKRLSWFTKGLLSVTEEGDDIVISDLRMGVEPNQYVFRFIVAERNETGEIVEVPNRMAPRTRDMSRLPALWDRIWDENVEF